MILSIIIPVYKVERYIRKTLMSIFGQHFSPADVEVIVVNDGTPDKSMQIVAEFSSEKSLKVISQENKGLSAARNAGLKIASGKYVWFVDSDDWLEDKALEKLIPILKDSKEDVLFLAMKEYLEDGTLYRTLNFDVLKPSSRVLPGFQIILNEPNLKIRTTPIQRYLINRFFLLDNNLYFLHGIYHEDIELSVRMLLSCPKVLILPIVGYCYLLRNSGSITSSPELRDKRCKSLKSIYDSFVLFEHENMLGKNESRALSYSKYKVASTLWNMLTLQEVSTNRLNIQSYLGKFKRDVIKNLYYDHKFLHLQRQLLFLFSPWILKKIGKLL